MKNTSSGWHVLYVKSQHEKKVDLLLKESELDSFLPTITTLRQWADRKKKVVKPLFPSYVFINVHSKTDFHKALNIRGVFKYLQFGNEYAKVKNEEIVKIKAFSNLEGLSDIQIANDLPKIGDNMKIKFGPLSGLECEVAKVNNKNRILVKIESLNQSIMASIAPMCLEQMAT